MPRTAARRHLLSRLPFGHAASGGKQFWLVRRVLRLGQSDLGAARLPRMHACDPSATSDLLNSPCLSCRSDPHTGPAAQGTLWRAALRAAATLRPTVSLGDRPE